MKLSIVADGPLRIRNNPKRLKELRETIEAQHTAELAEAGFFRRGLIRWHMFCKFHYERRKLKPSPYSLYAAS